MDVLRRQGRGSKGTPQQPEDGLHRFPAPGPGPDKIVAQREWEQDVWPALQKALHDCIDKLSRSFREVLVGRYFEGRTFTNLRDASHVKAVSTVSRRCEKAQALLKECLSRKGLGEEP